MKRPLALLFASLLLLSGCTEETDPDAPDSTEVINQQVEPYE